MNYPSGRADFEAIGRSGTPFENIGLLAEFKHFPKTKGDRILALTEALDEDKEQVTRYAKDLQRVYPNMQINCYLIYTIGAQDYRFFEV